MRNIPPSVITLWIPIIFAVELFLFLNGPHPQYWFIGVPALTLLGFMNTLAEVHRAGKQVRIQRWWGAIHVDKDEIIEISPSWLEGITRLRVRRFLPPWGVVYFVTDWSSNELLSDKVI